MDDRFEIFAALLLCILAIAACAREAEPPPPEPTAEPTEAERAAAAQRPPVSESAADDIPRRAFFGDSHVHTGWSADAGMDGAVTTPEDAYRFALGEEVVSNSGLKAQLGRPYA